MKRDMDLVRKILLHVEASGEEDLQNRMLELEGYSQPLIARHVEIMDEAGLVDAHVLRADGVPAYAACVFRLKWEGHDFLEATRNETIWAKTKQFVVEKGGGASIEIIKRIALKVAVDHFGLPGG
ncbi:MAG: DUF2513 domain-containing protein [Gemmatimonadales bacterium]